MNAQTLTQCDNCGADCGSDMVEKYITRYSLAFVLCATCDADPNL